MCLSLVLFISASEAWGQGALSYKGHGEDEAEPWEDENEMVVSSDLFVLCEAKSFLPERKSWALLR